MVKDTFQQTSSIISQLKRVMILIAAFILFCVFAISLSSRSTLRGLHELNSINNLLTLNSLSIESLVASENQFENIFTKKDRAKLQYIHETNQKLSQTLIENSIEQSANYPKLINLLTSTNKILKQFDTHYRTMIKKLKNLPIVKNKKETSVLMTDILIGKQLLLDAKETLRKVQILLIKDNNETFVTIYKNRFTPTFVLITLAIIFFIFVMTFGLSISKRIERSISNLLNATDQIAHGNLEHQVKILEFDEIGRLTNAFNNMVTSLKTGQNKLNQAMDRSNRLQSITASLSEALIPEQVYPLIFKQAFESLGATAAIIALLAEDKNFLELKRIEGYSNETYLKWKKFPLSADVPAAHVVRFRRPLFINTEDLKNFSGLNTSEDELLLASPLACLPLLIGSEAFGALSFGFSPDKHFIQEEKDFMIALAQQCAQTIQRTELYENAKQAIEARDEFLSIASHELRTPLTPLKLQVQGIFRQVKNGKITSLSSEQLQKMAESSERQINRLSALIDDLLDVSRITSGKFNLKKDYFSLKEIINGIIFQYSQKLQESNSSVDFTVEKDTAGYWDKLRIEQVIFNLLSNAVKYAPHKTIHISLSNENRMAKIIVRDEGPGIALADQERIFKRFERISSRENVGGLGLGLFISKQIIEAHKGKLYVQSSSNQGSVFVVELPEENLT